MIPLMGLLLSIYLAFKGLEIFQIAYSNKDAPGSAIIIGVAALIASCVIGGVFALLFLTSAATVPNLPTLTP
jgi:uncharacterized membrane protein (DUF485 family)